MRILGDTKKFFFDNRSEILEEKDPNSNDVEYWPAELP
jgi:hypothetical protein